MKSLNRVTLLGNVGAEVTPRYNPAGTAFARFSLATSVQWKDRETGEQREATEWHRCVALGKLGEVIGDHVKKGEKLYVEGRLKTRAYEKDGQKHYVTEIVVEDFAFAGGGRAATEAGPEGPPPADADDEGVPF